MYSSNTSGETNKDAICIDILKSIEAGNIPPWKKPWKDLFCRNCSSGHIYNGINRVILGQNGADSLFLTWIQKEALGLTLKKGSRSLPVFFYSMVKKSKKQAKTDKNDGQEEKDTFPLLKVSRVFKLADCEETEKTIELRKKYEELTTLDNPPTMTVLINALTSISGLKLSYGGNSACYYPIEDKIQLPNEGQFNGLNEFTETILHEIVHWTGHKSRLDRLKPGMSGYDRAKEELIAEIGASLLASRIGLYDNPDNIKAYCCSWLKEVKDKPAILFSAASKAEKAVDFILNEIATFEGKEVEL